MSGKPYVLYGVKGWGSALSEAMLTLCGARFVFEDVEGFDAPGPAHDKLAAINPLVQTPTLVLPDGEVMTESAAITLLLAERYPEAGLAPRIDDAALRPHFLRRLIWIVANIYPMFTLGDYPGRWVDADADKLVEASEGYKKRLWRDFESDIGYGLWVLGERFSALDIYVAVMTHYRPRRDWFAAECPKLHAIAERVDIHPILAPVLKRNFPDA